MKTRLISALLAFACVAVPALAQQAVTTVIGTDLFEPFAVVVDSNHDLYITDGANNRILRLIAETSTMTNFAGVVGLAGRGYQDGPGFQARFSNPQGIVKARGGFVVADAGNHRLRFIAPNGEVTTLAGGNAGATDGVALTAQFNTPSGLAVDVNGNIYVADLLNGSVRKLDTDDNVTTVASGFLRPSGVAVGPGGELYVADTGNHSIRVIATDGTVSLFAGSGSRFNSGSNDALIATEARFNNPRGLLWVGGNVGLVVADSGNRVLRSVFFNGALNDFTVETMTITVGAGFVSPVGLSRDNAGDLLVVDAGNSKLMKISSTEVPVAVQNPAIGIVNLVEDTFGGGLITRLTPISSAIFNNDVVVAIRTEAGTETFYTTDGTEPNADNGLTPPPYEDNQRALPSTILDTTVVNASPDTTIRAISTASGRSPSEIVNARFRFQVSNPSIIGSNPSKVSLEVGTTNAVLYYTSDGTEPTTNSTLYTFGTSLNITDGTNNVVLKVRGFKNGYAPSRIVSKEFIFDNLQTSTIGVPRDFVGGIGSMVIIPVEVDLRPGDRLTSLQFRLEVSPNGGAPLIPPQMEQFAIDPTNDFKRVPLPTFLTNLPPRFIYTNSTATGLLVGYLGTNDIFSAEGEATVAVFGVPIPATATEGQTYSISVLNPSGTSDGFENPVIISPMGPRTITVSNISYVVGDTAQSAWYNAGEFGNGNINNNDVNNVFYASLGIRIPYALSDIFDAMDAYPEDTVGAVGGDGLIGILDWEVIFRRSLRLDTNNWSRSWTAGGVRAVGSTSLNTAPNRPAEEEMELTHGLAWFRHGTLTGQTLENVSPGQKVSIPVRLRLAEGESVSGLIFRARVHALRHAPQLEVPLEFTPALGLPAPLLVTEVPSNVGVGWRVGVLDPALSGDAIVGEISFTIPENAEAGQGYMLRFSHVDGSREKEDGTFARYRFQSVPAGIWVQSSAKHPPTVISDEWRAKFFGHVSDVMSDPHADPDGDGNSNLEEFLAGTHPANFRLHKLTERWRARTGEEFPLRWFAERGSSYVVEATTDLQTWRPLGVVHGDGTVKDFPAPKNAGGPQFYRVREQE